MKSLSSSVGLVGWSEDRLRAKQIAYDHTIITSQQHASYFPHATPVVLKVLWEKETGTYSYSSRYVLFFLKNLSSARLVGAQAYGADGVDKRIDVLATAIS